MQSYQNNKIPSLYKGKTRESSIVRLTELLLSLEGGDADDASSTTQIVTDIRGRLIHL